MSASAKQYMCFLQCFFGRFAETYLSCVTVVWKNMFTGQFTHPVIYLLFHLACRHLDSTQTHQYYILFLMLDKHAMVLTHIGIDT